MKTYKDFEKEYIGESDVAALTMVGMTEECLTAQILHFGGDDAYSAYIVDEADVEIGKHYSQVASFKTWLMFTLPANTDALFICIKGTLFSE